MTGIGLGFFLGTARFHPLSLGGPGGLGFRVSGLRFLVF